MTKKTVKPKTKPETKTTEPEPTPRAQATPHVVAAGMPRFNFNARPTTNEERMDTTPIQPTYECMQQEARGPGADEWRQVDKLRSALSELYRNLQEDERYAPEYKSERAWQEYQSAA
jgi:hypothetical protein